MSLQFLLKKEESVEDRIIIANIIKKSGNTSYVVKDSKGRSFSVEGSTEFIVGQTVTVKKGIIIGRTKSLKSFKEYVV
jgi:hypothetical protein